MTTRLSLLGMLAATLALGPGTARAGTPEADDSLLNDRARRVAVRLHAEIGFVGVLSHRLQLGSEGTNVNLRRDMGQDTLFFFGRLEGDLDIGRRRQHTITLLYQPLDLRSQVVLDRDIRVEDVTFPADTAIDFRYGFPFWRGTYTYDFLRDDREVAIGGGLQIRNANLEYAAQDGSALRSSRNVGPVPLLKFRGRGYLKGAFWLGGEVSGFYAPIRFLNGGRTDVEGAIVDASLRAGLSWAHGVDTFLNVRWIGGGAQGTSRDPKPFSDGFSSNWLNFMAVSFGVSLR